MNDEGLNKLGHAINESGHVVLEMFGPPNALSNGDALSEGLYMLSECLIRGILPDSRGGVLGGEFGYGCDFENDVFLMHHDLDGIAQLVKSKPFWNKQW